MTKDDRATLLKAYRMAIWEGKGEIADLIEKVILAEMGEARHSPIVIGYSRNTMEPPWRVTCGPDIVPLDTKMEFTGIDHLSKEVTV